MKFYLLRKNLRRKSDQPYSQNVKQKLRWKLVNILQWRPDKKIDENC